MVFPTFRLLPVRTTASMMYNVTDAELPRFLINDRLFKSGIYNAAVMADQPEKVITIRHKGIMEMVSETGRDRTTGRIKFGTESNGGFKNITISNCVFNYCRKFWK